MNPQILQVVLGGVTGIGLLALVAFNKKLGLDFAPETSVMLLGVVFASTGIATHGASTLTAKKLDNGPELK